MTAFLSLHAAGVVRNGKAALLLGESKAGKSTLSTRLLDENFTILADDVVLVDIESLLSHPSERAIYLRSQASRLFPQYRPYLHPGRSRGQRYWRLNPEEIGAGCRAAPTPVHALIQLERACPGRPAALLPMSQTDATTALLRQSMNLMELGTSGLGAMIQLVRQARLFRLYNGDLTGCASLLSQALP
ncbi:MAG TPA: hypothetical protein PLP42_02740 [Acidobacteriota bacterium]|nr:hypothetical protein [Acidobacteriota bacterium]